VQKAKALSMQQTLLKYHKHACNLENLLTIRRQSHDAVKPNSLLENKKWPASYNQSPVSYQKSLLLLSMSFHDLLPTPTRVPPTITPKQNAQLLTYATRLAENTATGTSVITRKRKVSLAAEFPLSSRPNNMLLRKLALKAQRKIHLVDPKINKQLPRFIAIWTLDILCIKCAGAKGCEKFICGKCVHGRLEV
jgi:hypothetical protein